MTEKVLDHLGDFTRWRADFGLNRFLWQTFQKFRKNRIKSSWSMLLLGPRRIQTRHDAAAFLCNYLPAAHQLAIWLSPEAV